LIHEARWHSSCAWTSGRIRYIQNMELALNLVWLCVAIVGIVLQFIVLSRAAAPADQPPSPWRKTIAMGCTLVILFFVISMTDDLHQQEIVLEETKSSRVLSGTGVSSQPLPVRMVPIVFLPTSAADLTLALPTVRRPVEPPVLSFAAAIVCAPDCGRAPPASLA
jgi:hypothetical protein